MSKTLKTLLIIAGIVVLFVPYGVGKYNSFVTQDEGVKNAWSQVENQYQRRFDLIPNLVSTVKGVANFEKSTLEAVVNARSKATQTNVNVQDAQSFANFQKQQGEISSTLSRLLVVAEQYPELKATQNFIELQAQLEGTENRISVERKKFNETVQGYNISLRRFPGNLFARIFGFQLAQMFDAKEGAETPVKVDFGN